MNFDLALDLFSKDGVHFIGISGRDINESYEKLIFELAWAIISHYSIGNNKKSKDSFLLWANKRTQNYQNIQNFSPYGLSLCALLGSYTPYKINYESLDQKESERNFQLAMEKFVISVFIYPDDLNNQESKFDQLILLAQLSAAKTVLEIIPQHKSFEISERSVDLFEEIEYKAETNSEIESKEQPPSVKESLVINCGNKFNSVKTVKKIEYEDLKDTLLSIILLILFEFNIV